MSELNLGQKSMVIGRAVSEAGKFVGTEYLPSLRKSRENVEARVGSVDHYKEYLNRSPHYRVELFMYDKLARRLAIEANQGVGRLLNNNQSDQSLLMNAHIDFFYGWFAQDDYEDNSLFRGRQVAYHEMYGVENAKSVYTEARDRLIDRSAKFGNGVLCRIEGVLASLSTELEVETADKYHRIDLEGSHKPSAMIDHLAAKSRKMFEITYSASESAAGEEIERNVKNGLEKATEGMWVANDCKELSQRGIIKWAELKSGRINIPMAWMLDKLSDEERQTMIFNIDYLWQRYLPTTDRSKSIDEKLEVLRDCEYDVNVMNGLRLIENKWWTSGTVRDMGIIVANRLGSAVESSAQVTSSALSLYLGASMYHLGEKSLRLGLGRVWK